VTFDAGADGASVAWRSGADSVLLRGRRVLRHGVPAGRIALQFPAVGVLGQRAAPLGFDVPPGARVHVAARYSDSTPPLWAEDFEQPVYDPRPWPGGGGWRTAAGQLQPAGDSGAKGAWLRRGPQELGDTTTIVRVRRAADAGFGVAVRCAGPDHHVRFEAGAQGHRLVLVADGEERVLAEDDQPSAADQWLHVAIIAIGDNVGVYVDSRAILSGTVPWTTGGVALGALPQRSGTAEIAFDDLAIHTGLQTEGVMWWDDFARDALAGLEPRQPTGVDPSAAWRPEAGRLEHRPSGDGGASDGVAELLTIAGKDWGDYLVSMRCAHRGGSAATGAYGLVFRESGPGDWYRLGLRLAHDGSDLGVLELSRAVGGQEYTLRTVPVAIGARDHHLAVQVEGFRLQVFFDDALVMRELDGAHAQGRVGLFATASAQVSFDDFRVDRPVEWVPTLATVRTPSRLSIYGVEPSRSGGEYWLALTTPVLPVVQLLDEDGIAPFLVVEPERAWIDPGRYVHRFNRGFRGELGNDGTFQARVEWPDLPQVHLAAFGVTGWLVDAEGGARRWQ